VSPDAASGEVTAVVDGTPTDVVVDDGEAVIVVPELPPGSHTVTVDAGGQTTTVDLEVVPTPPTADARQQLADMIAEALRQLDEYLAAHPEDKTAADLRDALAAALALLPSLSDAEVQALYQQFTANPLPSSDPPGSCATVAAGQQARVDALLRKVRQTSWLAAKHAAQKSDATHVAVVLAQAHMHQALLRLAAYAQAVIATCGADALLQDKIEKARGRSQRSSKAAAALLR
jgi:hypothetical protein